MKCKDCGHSKGKHRSSYKDWRGIGACVKCGCKKFEKKLTEENKNE